MPGPLLHVGALLTCPHQAPITAPPSNTRVSVTGGLVLTMMDVVSVGGCPFQVPAPSGTKPQPCVKVILAPASKVLIAGQPAAILSPTVICQSVEQIPQGPPNSTATQTRAVAL